MTARDLIHTLVRWGGLVILVTMLTAIWFATAAKAAPNISTQDVQLADMDVRLTWDTSCPDPLAAIIHSHGAGGTRQMYERLAIVWARACFLVIRPDHPGAGQPGVLEGAERRQQQVGELVEALPWLADQVGVQLAADAFGHLVGISGHSFGAFTSQVAACAQPAFAWAQGKDYREERARAFLLLSPQGIGPEFADGLAWSTCASIPMLTITGTNDLGRRGEPADWRHHPFLFSTPANKYLVNMDGACHDLGGIVQFAPGQPGARCPDADMLRTTLTAASLFMRAYVLADPAALNTLQNATWWTTPTDYRQK